MLVKLIIGILSGDVSCRSRGRQGTRTSGLTARFFASVQTSGITALILLQLLFFSIVK